MATVERAHSSADIELSDINELLKQLHFDRQDPEATQHDLDTIASSAIFVVAREGSKVIGMATAYLFRKFGKTIGYVEDVVVNETYRGQGIGTKLMERIVDEARNDQVFYLYLTSREGRTAANAIYQKLGFEKRETNNYRLKF
ncbi:hypothetical protein A2763_01100 [Candidatus Kaiserbacteria bacterium RIFCSPHIGHO2_01_FULL_54_36]|uniref:N-acetyltransferase domain-containing protein n=1 Tax=Candidatus Kaiserbacteria bacterium RIFCSPHIGHO2_01_FULL_54_36 TaxID=1798482 RepID=A0A1F6CLK0_9BACT|nr:MAG: hypothetical protein A2763_01100 [Candidatus Kaiserbacteria bacterium RIFCSPHIGHO2_01_FULL_54_36]OGG75809.1 MAG: hypothetical protein A3A41_04160 [Candidatus Kaiserbacteria bacterium RIFCSPLOWO2_01_FULL_54_22]